MARLWGFWTEHKLDVLSDYLTGFTTASSKKAPHTVYLDLFAGQLDNRSRITNERIVSQPGLFAPLARISKLRPEKLYLPEPPFVPYGLDED